MRLQRALLPCFFLLLLASPWVGAEDEPGLLDRAQHSLDHLFDAADQAVKPAISDAPQHVAVLPAVGEGTPEQREDIRTAIHNSLSSRNFELKRPQETDLALVTAGVNPDALALQDPDHLAQLLGLEGLVYVDVLSVSKVYAGAYAQQKVSVRLRLYSAAKKAFIWEKEETQIAREGGLSLSLLGILTTVITSTKVLTEGVRQTLVDKLARNFASDIPQPAAGPTKAVPPSIQVAFSNWGDGPFRAGDEVVVYMKGETGLGANFDLGHERAGLPMREKAAGEYLGTYVVRENDNADNQMVVIHATRLSPRASLDWRVPGRIGLDNKPPSGVVDFKARPVREGVHLAWKNPDGDDTTIFTLERADPDSGIFSKLAEVATSEYIDKNVAVGRTWHYRITPHDAAKNKGPSSSLAIVPVAPGPTVISGDIAENTSFHALGSPYRLQGAARVARNATLTLEPGSVVEFGEGANLEVQGGIQSLGESDAPVSFTGHGWHLLVSDSGSRVQFLRQTRFDGGNLEIHAATVHFEHCIWRDMETGVLADQAADIGIESGVFAQNRTALRLGKSKTRLESVEFRGNQTALAAVPGASLGARDLLFDGNSLHVDTTAPVDLGAARFSDAGYPDLLAHLHGPVNIDWDALPADQNLLRLWSRSAWNKVYTALARNDQASALAGLGALESTLDANGRSLQAALEGLTGKKSADETASATPFARAAQNHGAWIWVQEVNLPYEAALADAPARLLEEAKQRFARALTSQRYPAAAAAAATRAHKLDLARHQRARLLLPGERDGAYWHYRVAWLLDRPALEGDLKLAGVLERDKSTLVVGLLNQGERGEATQRLSEVLQKQKIRFIDLGQGGYTSRAQEKAREAGVHLVLETRYAMDVSQTKLSADLKRFEAHLTLNLYDVHDTLVLRRFSATGSSVDFRESSGIEKALGQAFGQIEADILTSLWRLDEAARKPTSTEGAHE